MVFLSRCQVAASSSTPSPVSFSRNSEDDCGREALHEVFRNRETSKLGEGKEVNKSRQIATVSSSAGEEFEDDWSDCEAFGRSHPVNANVCSECREFNSTYGCLLEYLQDWLKECQLDIPEARTAEPSEQFNKLQHEIKSHFIRILQIASNAQHVSGLKRFLDHLNSHEECPLTPAPGAVIMSGLKTRLGQILTAWGTLCLSSREWQGKLQGALITNPDFFCHIARVEGFISRAETLLDEPIPAGADLLKYDRRHKALSKMMEGIASKEKVTSKLREIAGTLFVDPQAFQRGVVTTMKTPRLSYRFATPDCDRAMERIIEAEFCLQDLRKIGEGYIQDLLKKKANDYSYHQEKKSRNQRWIPRLIALRGRLQLGSFMYWICGVRYILRVVNGGVCGLRSLFGGFRRLV